MNKEYINEKENLEDLQKCEVDIIGEEIIKFKSRIITPEEIAENDLRAELASEIIKARQDKGISQKELEELSGVKQSIIDGIEKRTVNLRLDTVLKILIPLGKTLAVVQHRK